MSTHNICFRQDTRKVQILFGQEKHLTKSYVINEYCNQRVIATGQFCWPIHTWNHVYNVRFYSPKSFNKFWLKMYLSIFLP